MKYIFLYFAIAGSIIPGISLSQELLTLPIPPPIILPSPSSLEMIKYQGYPISYATGTVDVSVSLFSLELDNFVLPFSLTYHTSGVKNQDVPRELGLGWSLMPNIKITRIINGNADEICPININEIQYLDDSSMETLLTYTSPSTSSDIIAVKDAHCIPNKKDSEFDIFYLNLPNSSLAFILTIDDSHKFKVNILQESPITITPLTLDNNIYGFLVQDDNGDQYLFGDDSYKNTNQTLFTERNYYTRHITAWNLRKIELSNKEEINFAYLNIKEWIPNETHVVSILDDERYTKSNVSADNTYTGILNDMGYKLEYNKQLNYYSSEKVIREIKSNAFTCMFNYNQNKLKNIQLFSFDNNLNKNIEFYSDNFFLDSIFISGEGFYRFKYNRIENEFHPYANDYWGYYNGILTNTVSYPTGYIEVKENIAFSSKYTKVKISGANKEPNRELMKAKSLSTIYYPTGGKFEIEYEPHSFQNLGSESIGFGLRVKKTMLYDPISNNYLVKNIKYENSSFKPYMYPSLKNHITSKRYYTSSSQEDLSIFGGSSVLRLRSIGASALSSVVQNERITYRKVTETTDSGSTIFYYDNLNTSEVAYIHSNDNETIESYTDFIAPSFQKPLLTCRIDLDANGDTLKKQDIQYNISTEFIEGKIIKPYHQYNYPGEFNGNCNMYFRFQQGKDLIGAISSKAYHVVKGNYEIKNNVILEYFNNNITKTATINQYHEKYPYLLKKRTKELTSMDKIEEEIFYPLDIHKSDCYHILSKDQKDIYEEMSAKPQKTTPVLFKKYKNGKLIYRKLETYTKISERNFKPEKEYFSKGQADFEEYLSYRYNLYGNITSIIKKECLHDCYLWSYKNQYPIIKIEGIPYDIISSYLGQRYIQNVELLENIEIEDLEAIKLKISNSLPVEYKNDIIGYRYIPIIGIASILTSKNIINDYHYDNYGRLVREFLNNKIISRIKYNICDE